MESTLNISANLRAVDTIKCEILSEVSNLYRSLSEYNEAADSAEVNECIATIISMDYILARRAGISFSEVDKKITELLKMAVEGNHEIEVEFSDMSELKKYLSSR